jgi:hypothetical protein
MSDEEQMMRMRRREVWEGPFGGYECRKSVWAHENKVTSKTRAVILANVKHVGAGRHHEFTSLPNLLPTFICPWYE